VYLKIYPEVLNIVQDANKYEHICDINRTCPSSFGILFIKHLAKHLSYRLV